MGIGNLSNKFVLLGLITYACLGPAHSSTYVNSPIFEDQTWSSEYSPYIIENDFSISPEATLTISEGTIIKIAPNINFDVAGNIHSLGSIKYPVLFSSTKKNEWSGTADSWKGIKLTNSSNSIFENTVFEYAVVAINTAGLSPIKSHGNIFRNNRAAISDESGYESLDFSNNTFINNKSAFWLIRATGESHVVRNDFIDNETVFYEGYFFGLTSFNDNNIENNEFVITAPVVGYGYGTINAKNNWWGTVNTDEIDALIYDKNDNATYSEVVYIPYATSSFINAGSQVDPTINPEDIDNDGIVNLNDNCPDTPNPSQENNDKDSLGDTCDPDDDNDGMTDEYETTNTLNPFLDDANLDKDGDGYTNLEEYEAGSLANDANDYPHRAWRAVIPYILNQ